MFSLKFSCQDSICSNPEQHLRLFISKMFVISSYSIISVQIVAEGVYVFINARDTRKWI